MRKQTRTFCYLVCKYVTSIWQLPGIPVELAMAIERTLVKKDILGTNARQMVKGKFTLAHQAANYLKVYQELFAVKKI